MTKKAATTNPGRLTEEIRSKTIRRMLLALFKERFAELQRDVKALTLETYRQVIGEQNLALMKKLPKDYFQQNNAFSVRIDKGDGNSPRNMENVVLHFLNPNGVVISYGWRIEIDETVPQPTFMSHNGLYLRHSEPGERKLVQKWIAIEKRSNELVKETKALSDSTYQVLRSVTTVKKLIEVWPDAKDYLPPEVFEEDKALPAVVIGDLLTMIKMAKRSEQKAAQAAA